MEVTGPGGTILRAFHTAPQKASGGTEPVACETVITSLAHSFLKKTVFKFSLLNLYIV